MLDSPCKYISEERNFRGYKCLVQHVSGLEDKLLELGISELGVYFREVGSTFHKLIFLFLLICNL